MNEPAVVNFAPEPGSVELRDFTVAPIGEEDVLLEVGAVAVCGSDLHQWRGTHSWPVNHPIVLGHEFAGVVREVGARGEGWKQGDRVVSETAAVIDPNSPLSRQGRYHLDPSRRGFGYGVDGAMTRFVRVPARCLHRVPDGLPLEVAALTEPCCVAFHAVAMNSTVLPGDRIVVLGPGPIGLACAMVARLGGAQVAVAGLEQDRQRLGVAQELGCAAFSDRESEGLGAWVRERDGLGADGVVDAAGVSAALTEALDLVRPAGWITKVGWGPEPLGASLDPLVQKSVRLQGSFSHHWAVWERVLELLGEGRLDLRPLIGCVLRLERWQEAFTRMAQGAFVKAVLQPGATTEPR